MSLQKMAVSGSAALCAVGLILRAVGVSFGLELMLLGILGAVLALSLAQRTTQNMLATTRRNLTQRLREHGDVQGAQGEALDELTTLQRTTLWYVKNRPGSGSGSGITETPAQPRSTFRSGLAGRSSTPDVTNAAAGISFTSALDPTRRSAVGGVLTQSSLEALPEGTAITQFVPGRALELLEAGERLDLLVIDEAELSREPWSRSTGPAGISMMKDLLSAVHAASEKGVQTVIVPFDSVPDIHSRAFRDARALVLPLSEEATALQTSGAPITHLLSALDDLAVRRRSA